MNGHATVAISVTLLLLAAGCGESTTPPEVETGESNQVVTKPETNEQPAAAAPLEHPAPVEITTPATVTASVAVDTAAGRQAYLQYCGHCHDAGEGHPGTMRLAVRIDADHAVLLGRSDLAPEYVQYVVRNGLGMMPPFRPTEISDAALHHLAGFVGQNFDNN